ncbi:MAG: hypothetical protein ACERKZ_12665 [Lachnotalea sp.]
MGIKLQKYLSDEAFIVQSECGLSLVNAILQIVNAELNIRYGRKVIHHKSNRITSYESIIAKLERKGLERALEEAQGRINDLVEVRAICSYTDDLYQIAEILCNQKDVKLIKRKDYIKIQKHLDTGVYI